MKKMIETRGPFNIHSTFIQHLFFFVFFPHLFVQFLMHFLGYFVILITSPNEACLARVIVSMKRVSLDEACVARCSAQMHPFLQYNISMQFAVRCRRTNVPTAYTSMPTLQFFTGLPVTMLSCCNASWIVCLSELSFFAVST